MNAVRKSVLAGLCAAALALVVAAPVNAYTDMYLTPPLPSGSTSGTVTYPNGANPGCKGHAQSSAGLDKASTTNLQYGCTWVGTYHWYRPAGQTTYYKTYTGLQSEFAGTSVKRELVYSQHLIWV